MIGLAINILNAAAVMHNAGVILTVAEIKRMAQFVNGFFDNALIKTIMDTHGKAFVEAVR
jgi:hypothetical protein